MTLTSSRRYKWIMIFLITIGCVQMIGDISGLAGLRAFGIALHASPAPKVFTAQKGFETFSNRLFVHWFDKAGQTQSIELTPEVYRRFQGPYNRRNAYGAMIAYAPVFAESKYTRDMHMSALRYALCTEDGLLKEIGINDIDRGKLISLELQPVDVASRDGRWQLRFDVACMKDRKI